MTQWLRKRLVERSRGRLPSRVTAAVNGKPAMFRWFLVPLNRWLNIYIHQFLASDEHPLHDHPWWSLSFLLEGRYVEVTKTGRRQVSTGQWLLRPPWRAHRIELIDDQPCWSLFIVGPVVREWGFYCPGGWQSWREYNVNKLKERANQCRATPKRVAGKAGRANEPRL